MLGCLLSPDKVTVFVDGVAVNQLREPEKTAIRQKRLVSCSRPSGSFTHCLRSTMWLWVLKFAIPASLGERKWRETCSFNSACATSFIKCPTNSAPERSSESPLRELWQAIRRSFSQRSQLPL